MVRGVATRLSTLLWALCARLHLRPPMRLLPGFGGPLVSVVMPVYGVERYVADAVASVLAQTHRRLELIVIDDGSTDGSTDIVKALARRDPRVRYVRTENGGLAAARNRGAERARGTYLMFVDSDDLLTRTALATMVARLERTGSDLATGNVSRFRDDGTSSGLSWNQSASHARDLDATTMAEHPLLVRDTTAWNKLFRRSYFSAQQIEFPEGRLYEDMAPITRALVRARAVDVVHAVVYRWRIRDEANSITQRRFEIPNITDKADMLLACLAEIEHVPALRQAMLMKIFQSDLWVYVPHVGVGDDAFDAQYGRIMALWSDDLLDTLQPDSIVKLIVHAAYDRLGPRAAHATWLWGSVPWQELPTVVEGGRVMIARPDDPDLSSLPAAAFDLTRFIGVRATVTELQVADGVVRIGGWAYLPQVGDAGEQQVTAALIGPGDARLAVPVTRRAEPAAAEATRSPWFDLTGAGFCAEFDPGDLADGTWQLALTVAGGGIERQIVVDQVVTDGPASRPVEADVAGRTVRLAAAKATPLRIEIGPAASGPTTGPTEAADVAGVEAAGDDRILLTPGSGATGRLLLVDAQGVPRAETDWSGEPAELALTAPGFDGVSRVLPSGRYRLRLLRDGEEVPLRLAAAAATSPRALTLRSARVVVGLGRGDEAVLDVRPPLPPGEAGPFARRTHATRWWHGSPAAPQDAVFLSSFSGRAVACHPAAIGRALRRAGFSGPIHVDVADRSVPVPDGFSPVLHRSDDWYRAIGTSRWIIANTALNADLAVREGQTYLQTWHGTPLKRIGADIARPDLSIAWLQRAEREARDAWTQLLSTSPFTTRVLPHALSFAGPLIEAGSPRLDELARDPDHARDRARHRLGIEADRTVVLYTPTWRDGGGASELLDLELFQRRLGDRVTLLVRAHPNVWGRAAKRPVDGQSVIDVARYPVVEDLFSAADVHVTDYSSTLFDFAVTGRPQILFTPDLERYRDDVRGFYLDLERWAPGPVVRTTGEVLDLLADPAAAALDEQTRAAFAAEFLPWEDGNAAARVIDALGIG